MNGRTRRELLLAATSLGAVSAAGCLGRASSPLGGSPSDEDGDGIVGTSIETVGSDCGDPGDDDAAATLSDGTASVEGVFPAPDPCHEAVLETASYEDGTLSVRIGAKSTRDGEPCPACVGAVEYEASVELDDASGLETVTVVHATPDGEEHELDPRDGSPGTDDESDHDETDGEETDHEGTDDNESDDGVTISGSVVDASIETVGTDCAGPDDGATASLSGDTVTIEGVLPAGTPCHEAVLEIASYEAGPSSDGMHSANDEAGTLSVTIDAADTGETCVQCAGAVTYRAEVELEDASGLDTVMVDHATPTGSGHRIHPGQDHPDEGSPAVVSTSIETVDSGCGTGEDDAVVVTFEDDAVALEGVLPAPNPCHEADFASIGVDAAELSLRIDVRSTLEDGEGCVECVGAISYEAVVELEDSGAIESVQVDHATGVDSVVTR